MVEERGKGRRIKEIKHYGIILLSVYPIRKHGWYLYDEIMLLTEHSNIVATWIAA